MRGLGSPVPRLATERLTLRLPKLDDAERVALLLNDLSVSGNLSRVPHPYHLRDALAYLRSRKTAHLNPAETAFAIDLRGIGFIGQVGYHTDQWGQTVLGYYLGRPYWGHGFMTEAVEAALKWYFSVTDAVAVRSGVFDFNAASLAIQRKMGFVEIGTSRLLCLARGEELRHIDTELTRAAWEMRSK